MKISRALYDDLIAHAREDAPNECCGMIGSVDDTAVVIHRAINKAASPLRYEIEARDQYKIEMAIDDAGQDLGAIYHSHTRTDPIPSQTDVNLAFHPDSLYIIVGVKNDEPDVRAWKIRDGGYEQGELIVED